MKRILLSLALCSFSCDAVWSSYKGAAADHCVVTPSRCGMAEECNPTTGECQPSTAPKLTVLRITDCEASSLTGALTQPDPVGFQVMLKSGCTYKFKSVHNHWFGPNALPLIDKKVVIEGNGAVLEGGADSGLHFRLATIAGTLPQDGSSSVGVDGVLVLRNLTIRGFSVRGGNGGSGQAGPTGNGAGGGAAGLGGAIFVQGRLELYGVTLHGNRATGGDGTGASVINSLGGAGGGGGLGSNGGEGGDGRAGGGGGGFRYDGCKAGTMGLVGAGGGFLETCESTSLKREGGLGGSNGSKGGVGFGGSTPGTSTTKYDGGAGGGQGGLGGTGGVAADLKLGQSKPGGAAGDGGGGGGGGVIPASTGATGGGGGAGFLGGGGGNSASFPSPGSPDGGGGGGGFGGGGGGGTEYGGGGGGGVGGGGGGASVSHESSSTFSGGGGGGFGGGGGGGSLGGTGGFGGGGGNYGGKGGFGGGSAAPAFQGGGSGGGLGAGGALFVLDGTLVAANSTFFDNAVKGGAGGEQAGAASSLGGAIFNLNGNVSLYNVTVVRNETISTATGLPATSSEGGAIYQLALGTSGKTAQLAIFNSILSDSKLGSPLAHDLVSDSRAGDGSAKIRFGKANHLGSADSGLGLPTKGPAPLPATADPSAGPAVFVPDLQSAVVNVGESAICYSTQVAGRDARGQLRKPSCTLGAVEADVLMAPSCAYLPRTLPGRPFSWLDACGGFLFLLSVDRLRRSTQRRKPESLRR